MNKNGLKETVVMCLLRCNDKFLLLRRNQEPHKDKLIPPGGHVDPFETPDNAAKRETFEETGINIDNFKMVGIIIETSPTRFNYINIVYIADVDYFEPNYCDEGVLEWHDKNTLRNKQIAEFDIIKSIEENKFFVFDVVYDENINIVSFIEKTIF